MHITNKLDIYVVLHISYIIVYIMFNLRLRHTSLSTVQHRVSSQLHTK